MTIYKGLSTPRCGPSLTDGNQIAIDFPAFLLNFSGNRVKEPESLTGLPGSAILNSLRRPNLAPNTRFPSVNMESLLINRSVLMLNQNYEPLTICSARRAIVLLFQGKAEMIETADGLKVRTISRSYSLPSVVRLWHYKAVPFKRIMLTRKNILMRDGNSCQYCGTTKGPMTVDHVIPKTMGGKETWENLVCSCAKCNNKKGDHTPEQSGMRLLKKPTRPTYITFIQRNHRVDDRWKPYLFMDSTIGGATT